jgi:gliding motility-associated-like protein
MSGVQYDPATYPMDTLTGYPLIEAECGDTSFTVKFHIALDCYSINDVDFRMTNSVSSQPTAIQKLWSVCNVNEETDSIRVVLLNPFNQTGRYYMYSKKGNDGNTLINKCGIPMNEFDTIVVLVGPCPAEPAPGEIDQPLEGLEPGPQPQPIPTPVPRFPNVMTPNEDGKNDYFTIGNADQFTNVRLVIFNRWGKPVYQTDNYNNDFGGTIKLSDGVYFYEVELYFQPNDVTLKHSSTLTVLR